MNENLNKILHCLIIEHIASAEPVGSSVLVEKYNLNISPATARQRLSELETLGYIHQPHTSAGRIPTERSYREYAQGIFSKCKLADLNSLKVSADEVELKSIAKNLAQESNLAVFCAFTRKNLYYTGISNLLKQPEFSQMNKVYDISQIIDEIDEIIDNSFNTIAIGEHILVGSENPFGSFCSSILIKYRTSIGDGMLGIIGPMRMDYKKNIRLIKLICSNLK
ncbi:hypothetical protein ISS03_00855 [Patescibacteria group bacterium]|nr:hypothetical protein [Patescibacteria group bacterium]